MNWHEYFTYDESTGNLIWKERPREHFDSERSWKARNVRFAGKVAGSPTGRQGYVDVRLDHKMYRAHRIIIEMHDPIPLSSNEDVDHIDGVKANNMLSNLRRCTRSQNLMNQGKRPGSKNPYKGVQKHGSKYTAMLRVGGRPMYLGTYPTPEEAFAVYCAAAIAHRGQFARTE